jgi:RNA 3'-terminal phosphate cyclase-like protein
MLKFINPTHFRQIITCSILSERPVIIENLRAGEDEPGLAEYEVTFLKLIELITNGTKIQIDETGCSVKFYPGIITNNDDVHFDFDCGIGRAITYYLEFLVIISLFGKAPLQCSLTGVTNDELDLSVDAFSNCTLKLLKEFGLEGDVNMKIIKRGFRPLGGGEVKLRSTVVKQLKSVQLTDEGFVKRIRGWSYASKVSPQILNRIISSARNVLNDYIPDVWIYSDHYKGPKSGLSSGYGVTLVTESTTGCQIAVDEIFEAKSIQEESLPEVIGEKAAMRLLDELLYSGYVDTTNQSMVFLLMALSEKKISLVKIGRISAYSIQFLRNLRTFFGIKFQFKDAENPIFRDLIQENNNEENMDDQMIDESLVTEIPQNLIVSCLGIGLVNMSRKLL